MVAWYVMQVIQINNFAHNVGTRRASSAIQIHTHHVLRIRHVIASKNCLFDALYVA